MSTTIDQKVVEMRFDNKQFENNVQTSMSTIDKLKQNLNMTGAAKGLESIGLAAKNCDMSGLGSAVQTVQAKFSALGVMGVTALSNITNSAINAGKRIVSALTIDPIKTGFNEYELKMGSIQTIMASTGENLGTVTSYLDKLNEYSDKTIYSFSDMTTNIGKFTNAGVKLEDAVSAIKGISNEAAISGANANEASRAMYNFAQAISSGHVKLIDWKSIELANMATVEFKNHLLDTALSLGTVVKEGDKYKTTTTDAKGEISSAFDATSNFNEALSHQWMTTDVLVDTLKGYSDETSEIGKKAYAAAQDIKTLSQLFDTLKESAQSGWSQTWEIGIGDFDESKKLLTEMSGAVGKMISDTADARNKFLSEGLSTGWKQLLSQGIVDEEGYKKSIQKVAKAHGLSVGNMLKDQESFEVAIKSGKITADILGEALNDLTSKTRGLSKEQLKEQGYSKEQIADLEKMNKAVQNGSLSLENFANKMSMASGRENLIQALWNSFKALADIIKPIKEAFVEIFPPYTGEQLYSLIEKIREITASFKISAKTSANLKSTFKGLFAVLDIIKQAFSAVFKAVSPLFGGLNDLGEGILGTTALWGEWLVKLDKTIKTTDIFNKVIQNVSGFITDATTAIKNFVKTVAEKIDFSGLEIFSSFFERVNERMTQVGDSFGKMKSGVAISIEIMGEALAKSDFLKMMQSLWDGVKTIAKGITSAFGALTRGIVEKIGNADFKGALDIINSLIAGGIGVGLMKFINTLTKITKDGKGFLGGIKGIKDAIIETFGAIQTSLKAEALIKIATAIGILAASLLVISLLDSEKLTASLGAITVLFANLMASMAIFNKTSGKTKGVVGICTIMVGLSVAVLILASALKKIGELDFQQLAIGLAGIIGLTATMVASAKIMGNGSATVIKGATQMVIFAAAIKILASACEDLSKLDWNQLAKGLVGVGVLMTEISIFLKTAKFSSGSITTATGIVILAAGIKILASACEDFGKMHWEDIGKGLTAIGGLLAEIIIFTNLTGNAKHVISTGIALVAIGASMKIFASAIKDFGEMQWDEVGRGLAAMAGALLAVTLAVNFMPKNMLVVGIGLITVSTALVILAEALGKLGNMDWNAIAKGLVALGGSMAILAIGLHAMNGTLAGSAAFLIAVGTLAILTPILTTLGAMSWEGIAKGLITIAGAFTIIGIAGLLLTPLIATILGLGAAFALIGVGVLGIGVGLLAAGAGLSAIAIGFTALATSVAAGATGITAALIVIITGIISLIPAIIKQIGEGIISLCTVIAEGAPAIGEAVKAIVLSLVKVLVECIPAIANGALELVVGVMNSLVKYTPKIIDAVFQFLIDILEGVAKNLPGLIKAAIDVLMAFFKGVVDALNNIDISILLKGIAGIGLLSAIMVALAAVAILTPAAILGVLGMAAVIVELGMVLSAIGALAQIPGLTWLIGEGGKLLHGIGTAIGSFIGGIVGGFMGGVSGSFPKIGKDLSLFMTNIRPFIEGAKNINASAMKGVNALAQTILILTAANILDGLTSWFTGGSSLAGFAKELIPFGTAMKIFSKEVKDIDGETVSNAAIAGKTLAEMAAILPNTGGVVGFFAGENNMGKFAEQLIPFGRAIKNFSDEVTGLDASVITEASTAGKALAEMADTVPNSGGVVGFFAGENDINSFGERLVPFGKAMKDFSYSVTGIKADVIASSVTAGKALVELASSLPNTGGAVKWFTGDNDIGAFGNSLVSFGKNFSAYSNYMTNVDSGILAATTNVASSIVELQKSLPKDGGWFSNEATLADFGRDMSSFGYYFNGFYSHIGGINLSLLSGVIAETNNLVAMAKGISNFNTSSMSAFGKALATLGQNGIKEFINSFTNANEKVAMAATTMLAAFIRSVNAKKAEITVTFNNIIQAVITTLNGKKRLFDMAGNTLMVNFISGIKSQGSNSISTIVNIISSLINAIKNKYYDFYDVGRYFVEGFAEGISDNIRLAEEQASELAAAAANASKRKLDEHSPSKVGYGIGNFFGLAFVNAISDYKVKAYKAGEGMAESARNGLSKTVSKIIDIINSDIDTQPTIRPVLDLSDITMGTNKLNALFSRSRAMSISTGLNKTIPNELQNEDSKSEKGNLYQFTQNNYSPKALSRLEIYRQTKNQFSAMKGLV